MRLLKLRFENINSLRGVHEVDFTGPAFRHSNLFAIVGPTGAGKTTLLDVITLTLYNRIPRLGKLSPELLAALGAVVSRGTARAESQVTFQCREGVFQAKWTLEKTPVRRGERKGEFDWREALELSKEDGTILSSKKSDVLEIVRGKVGLDYEQFVKAILLSQGDFAAFLKASPKDRSELLERITGTEIYRTLGARAFAKWHYEKKKDIDDARAAIRHVTLLTDEEVTEKNARLAVVAGERRQVSQEKEAAETALTTKRQRLDQQTQLDAIRQVEKPRLDAQRRLFDETDAPRLRRHEALLTVARPLTEHDGLVRQTLDHETRQQRLQEGRKTATENRAALLRSLEALLGRPVEEARAADQLTDFQEEVRRLDAERQKAETRTLGAKQNVAEKLGKIAAPAVTAAWRNPGSDAALAALREHYKSLKAEQTTLRQREAVAETADVRAATDEAERRKNDLQELVGHVNLYQQLARQLSHEGEPKGLRQQVEAEEKTLLGLRQPRQQARDAVNQRREAREAAVERKYAFLTRSALPRLKAALREGEPCAVCGATHHPARHHLGPQLEAAEAYLTELADLDEEIKRLVALEEGAGKQLQQVETTFLLTNQRLEELQARIADAQAQQQAVQAQIAPLKTRLGLERIGKADEVRAWLAAAETRLTNFRRLQTIETDLATAKDLADALNAFVAEQDALRTAEAALKARYGGDPARLTALGGDFLQKLARREYQPEAFAEDLKTTTETLARLAQERLALETTLLPTLQNLGFDGPDAARRGLLPAADVERLKKAEAALTEAENRLLLRESALKQELAVLAARDTTDADLPALQAAVDGLKSRETDLNREEIGLQFTLDQNEKNKHELAEKRARVEDLERRNQKWYLLSETLGDRQGDRFNRFAQRLTLAHLVRGANHHLRDLTERYRLLPPTGEEDDLKILDLNFDESRAVATLSGGETFLVSLALALGLSDLVSQNVRLESLFIDEGFGTLDPDTLEMALGTLEKLQGQSGKLIGIISHVEALKERITTQIRLKKHPGGFSELEIV